MRRVIRYLISGGITILQGYQSSCSYTSNFTTYSSDGQYSITDLPWSTLQDSSTGQVRTVDLSITTAPSNETSEAPQISYDVDHSYGAVGIKAGIGLSLLAVLAFIIIGAVICARVRASQQVQYERFGGRGFQYDADDMSVTEMVTVTQPES